MLIYDEKVMEDIDDLSDTEKVSLISDLELNDDNTSVKTKGSIDETKDDLEDNVGELNLNMLKINKL